MTRKPNLALFSEELRISSASDTALRWTVGLASLRDSGMISCRQRDTIGGASFFEPARTRRPSSAMLNLAPGRVGQGTAEYRLQGWHLEISTPRGANTRGQSTETGQRDAGCAQRRKRIGELGRRSGAVGATPLFAVLASWPDEEHMLYVVRRRAFGRERPTSTA